MRPDDAGATHADAEAFRLRIASLLSGATDMRAVLARLAEPWQQALLWRCAIASRVDRAVFDAVLGRDLATTPAATLPDADAMWQWLCAHTDLERAPGLEDAVMVRETARVGLFAPEGTLDIAQAEAVQRTAAALAAHYRGRSDAWQGDWLGAHCLADPAAAQRWTRRTLRATLKRGDFTAALHLLRVIEGRAPLLRAMANAVADAATLHAAIDELRREYDAARLFSTDFEKSTHALEREVMREAWQWARSGARDARWLLNLEAQGGSGKTIFLRWLAARRCQPHGVPYARLDFDFVDARLTAAAPWYLLAQLARALDPQLPGRPFRELVRRADDVVDPGRFALGAAEAAQALAQLRSPTAAALGASIVTEFTQLLRGASMASVVVVLDTLEVALLEPGADVMALLEVLATVHAQVPALRVIVSGRFDLEQRLPTFAPRFGGKVRTLALTRLSDSEALEFLTTLRGMPNGPVARAIVARSRGLPFALALFADEWLINPRLTVRDVQQVPGPELHYLVERVLKRIPRPIAWLLRYSVVARRLTRTFLADVIVPELEELRRGGSHDNPLRDQAVVARYFDDARSALGEAVLSPDRLWADLERHASAFSFVSRDDSVAGALKLHEEVVRPLSRELRRHRVLKRLHRAAMRKASARAGTLTPAHEAAWVAEQKEALYHALRLSTDEGRALWTRLLAQTTRAAAHEARRQLAEELLDESLDLPASLREQAARERAEASLALAEQYDRSYAHEWGEAERAVALWRELVPRSRRATDGRLAVAEVRVQARVGVASAQAVRRLERLLRRTRAAADRLAVLLTLQRAARGTPAGLRHAEAARKLLDRAPADIPTVTRLRALLQVTDELLQHGDYAGALGIVTEVARTRRALTPAEQLQLLAQQAWLLSTCGEHARLARVAARVPELDAEFAPQLTSGAPADEAVVIARAVLRRELVRGMIEGGPEAPPPFEGNLVPPLARAIDATTDADIAYVEADAVRTLSCIGRAREMLPQGAADELVTLFLGVATVMRDLVGDVRQARSALLAAQSAIVADGSDAWWNVRLVRCIQGESDEDALAQMRAQAKRAPSISADLAIALARLAIAARLDGDTRARRARAATDALLTTLARITPLRARRRHLFRTLPDPRLVPTDPRRRDALVELLGLARTPRDTASDAEWVEHLALRRFAHADVDDATDRHAGSTPPRTLRTAAGAARAACMAGDDPPTATCDDAALTQASGSLAAGIARYMRARARERVTPRDEVLAEAMAARHVLEQADVPPSIWLARTHLLIARLLPDAGERKQALAAAEEVTERLGSAMGGNEVARAYEALAASATTSTADTSIITLDIDHAAFDARFPLARALRSDTAQGGGAITPVATVAHLATDLAGALKSMRKLLPAGAPASASSSRLVFVGSDRARAALPWELAHASDRVATAQTGWRSDEEPRRVANERWLTRALHTVEPVAYPHDAATKLRLFQQRHGLSPSGTLDAGTLRLLVVALRGGRPPRVVLALAGREYGPAGDIEQHYRGHPVQVITPARSATAVLREIAEQTPDVVHIVAPVVESRSFGGLAFDLAEGSTSNVVTGARYLPVAELTSVLKRPDSVLRPLMVVHNTLDRLPLRELWRQYALRNIAAMELARSGSPVATVALSTGWLADGVNALAPLLEVIATGAPLQSLVEAQDALTRDGRPRALSTRSTPAQVAAALEQFGTVVFANNPAWVAV
ncbi:MAG: hypothetical protein LCH84_01345 [Gemmatimonadetes bacterium]|nr:hypothetical protein [Gemmatimonadota bacterium]